MDIPINIFKGLYTNIDPADLEASYFTKFKNVKVYPGYMKGEGYHLSQLGYELPVGHEDEKIVYYDFVFLDEDKLKNEFRNGLLIRTYKQNIQKYEFLITYDSLGNQGYKFYRFWLKKSGDSIWVQADAVHISEEEQIPIVVNENNILKIFFTENAYWLGPMHRRRWKPTGAPSIYNAFYLRPLIEVMVKDQDYGTVEFTQENTFTELIEIGSYEDDYIEHPLYGSQHRFSVYDKDGQFIRIGTGDGYIWSLNVLLNATDYTNIILAGPMADFNPHITASGKYHMYNLPAARNGISYSIHSSEGGWHYVADTPVDNWYLFAPQVQGQTGLVALHQYFKNMIRENPGFVEGNGYSKIIRTSTEGIEPSNVYVEILVTVLIDGIEYPWRYSAHDLPSNIVEKYIVKISPIVENQFPQIKTEALVFYARYGTGKEDNKNKDFEQFTTLGLLNKERPFFQVFLTSLTQNGIFLAQTVGKAIDPDTYEIINNPDDYITIGGVSYILKGSNVHFPAVGNGNILNNIFYPENYVPGITGNFLVSYANALGVYKKDQEQMTILDFQPVEGTMLFYVKDEAGYRIKSYEDIIETADGSFLYLKEGIYIINQQDREWLSEPINDIVEAAWNNGSGRIFYNSYEKELYFLSSFGYYVFRFRTRDWSEFTLTFPKYLAKPVKDITGPQDNDPIVDVVDDYEGNTYFLTKLYKYKLLPNIAKKGSAQTVYFGGSELKMKKILASTRYDLDGKLYYDSKQKETSSRKVVRIFNHVRKRIPSDGISVNFDFEGTLYALSLTIAGYPVERL